MVGPFLLDTNVLLALAWPTHIHHAACATWFAAHKSAGFRTCPLTQLGFVRISCNPSFTKDAVSPAEATRLLRMIIEMPDHGFWEARLNWPQVATEAGILTGHAQFTDAYLLALAKVNGGQFATLDRRVLHHALAPGLATVISFATQ